MTKPAHPEIIGLLETYLHLARHNSFSHVAISMVGHPGIGAMDFAGEVSAEGLQLEAMGILRERLDTSVANWAFPPQDTSLDASYVRYNVVNGSLGFDFLCWLVDAEMTRVREGAPAPLKVGFWLGRDPAETLKSSHRVMWLNNVFRPALRLIGAVEDERAIYGRHKEVFVPRDIIKASRNGEQVPRFRPPRVIPIRSGRPPVTITLREAEYGEERNSNIAAWTQFAAKLQDDGERVIFVRDTAKADWPMNFFETYPAASVDLGERMSLYAAAKANLFVSNGPAILAVHSDRPWLEFIDITDDLFQPNSLAFWSKCMGLTPPDQYPWSACNQRIVWKRDTYENIAAAWDEHIEAHD